jgi:hypothetical protein
VLPGHDDTAFRFCVDGEFYIWELWGGVSESLKDDKAKGKNLQRRALASKESNATPQDKRETEWKE